MSVTLVPFQKNNYDVVKIVNRKNTMKLAAFSNSINNMIVLSVSFTSRNQKHQRKQLSLITINPIFKHILYILPII
jgi:hypothetical protein